MERVVYCHNLHPDPLEASIFCFADRKEILTFPEQKNHNNIQITSLYYLKKASQRLNRTFIESKVPNRTTEVLQMLEMQTVYNKP
jgi:hypothetical protein